MAQELKVLLVDDDETLTYAILRELSGGAFYPLSFLRVNTLPGLREAVDSRSWHIILAGTAKSGVGGLSTLRFVRDAGKKTPVVLLTRSAEGLDIEEVKQKGASDVLSVGEIRRLDEVVRKIVGVHREF